MGLLLIKPAELLLFYTGADNGRAPNKELSARKAALISPSPPITCILPSAASVNVLFSMMNHLSNSLMMRPM